MLTQAEAERLRAARKAQNGWMHYWFQPVYNDGARGSAELAAIIYAPDLGVAFKLARVRWPGADGWKCLGAADPEDRTKCLPRTGSWKEEIQ